MQNAQNIEWKTLGTGTFSPSSTAFDVTYTPSDQDLLNGTIEVRLIAESCVKDSLDFPITFLPGPKPNAGSGGDICVDNLTNESGFVLNGTGGLWSTNGSGSFTPSTSDLNATYEPSLADIINGSITLYLTSTNANNCADLMDSVIYNILEFPEITALSIVPFCKDQDTVIVNSSITEASSVLWTTNGSGVFHPNTSEPNTSYVLTADDKTNSVIELYVETLPENCHLAHSATITLDLLEQPIVSVVPNQEIC